MEIQYSYVSGKTTLSTYLQPMPDSVILLLNLSSITQKYDK